MANPQRDPQLLKGVLPMLVLALLTEQESYGYELVTRLQAAGLADIAAGSVYPVLTRLERDGQITSRLVASSAGPARKYYLPTSDGGDELDQARRGWADLSATVATVLARVGAAASSGTAATPTATSEPATTAPPTTDPATSVLTTQEQS